MRGLRIRDGDDKNKIIPAPQKGSNYVGIYPTGMFALERAAVVTRRACGAWNRPPFECGFRASVAGRALIPRGP